MAPRFAKYNYFRSKLFSLKLIKDFIVHFPKTFPLPCGSWPARSDQLKPPFWPLKGGMAGFEGSFFCHRDKTLVVLLHFSLLWSFSITLNDWPKRFAAGHSETTSTRDHPLTAAIAALLSPLPNGHTSHRLQFLLHFIQAGFMG